MNFTNCLYSFMVNTDNMADRQPTLGKLLATYNRRSPLKHELEVRVCYKRLDVSNVGAQLFESVLHDLQLRASSAVTRETVDMFCNDLRVVRTDDGSVVVEKKTRVMHCFDLNTSIPFANLKWSLATEDPQAIPPPTVKPIMSRHKTVHAFSVCGGRWKLVMSRVVTDRGYRTYEIEVEHTSPTHLVRPSECMRVTEYLERLLAGRLEPRIVRMVNALIGRGYDRFAPTLEWSMNKPVNLKASHVHAVTAPGAYSCFRKVDGVRTLMFSRNKVVHVFSETSRVQTFQTRIPDGTILDAECVRGKFHVFDILVHMWRDVRKLPFTTRREILSKIPHDTYIDILAPTDDFEAASRWIAAADTDGIVFVPNAEPYRNTCTYKYKRPCDLTIDFYVSDSRIYTVNAEGNHVEFTAARVAASEISEFMDKRIVEFAYDKDECKFVPVRMRADKVRPNYIDVAHDVWTDIQSPLDLSEFLASGTKNE